MNTKVVNVYPNKAITSINPPIRSKVMKVTMPITNIRKCIIERAIVDEVLPDGRTVRLDFTNYDKDNSVKTVEDAIKEAESKIEDEVTDEITVDDSDEEDEIVHIVEETDEEEAVPAEEEKVEDAIEEVKTVETPTDTAAPVVESEEIETMDVDELL